MPGKYIDRFVLTLGAALFFYLFFLNAWGSIPLACALAFLCCGLLFAILRNRPRRFRCTSAEAEAELMRISAMNDIDAERCISALIHARYPGETFTLISVVKHPGATLSAGEVFGHWRRHRDCAHLLIACTCPADPRAAACARDLQSPKTALLERRHLLRMIRLRGVPENVRARIPLLRRLKRVPGNLSLRCAGPKTALTGLLLIALHLLNGSGIYLAAGLVCLFAFACGLPRRFHRRRLF